MQIIHCFSVQRLPRQMSAVCPPSGFSTTFSLWERTQTNRQRARRAHRPWPASSAVWSEWSRPNYRTGRTDLSETRRGWGIDLFVQFRPSAFPSATVSAVSFSPSPTSHSRGGRAQTTDVMEARGPSSRKLQILGLLFISCWKLVSLVRGVQSQRWAFSSRNDLRSKLQHELSGRWASLQRMLGL